MREDLSDRKAKEIDNMFCSLSNEQAMTMAILSMERMWMPFKIGGIKFSSKLVEYVNECMNLIWNRIICGEVLIGEYEKLGQQIDLINEVIGDEDSPYELQYSGFLLNAISSGTGWFFEIEDTDKCWDIPILTLDMIIGYIGDLLPDFTDDEIENHTTVLAELKRIAEDYQLVKDYPQNIEKILIIKEYYHNLMVLEPYNEHMLFSNK